MKLIIGIVVFYFILFFVRFFRLRFLKKKRDNCPLYSDEIKKLNRKIDWWYGYWVNNKRAGRNSS